MNIEISDMQKAAEQAAGLMQALSNPNRLLLLCALVGQERSVGSLVDELGLRQTSVSQQLALLRKEGLVTTRRDGQTIYYSLADESAAKVIKLLYDLYCN